MSHKAGFVTIIGKPNVGKSTLMNQMLGEKLSIVTPKAQTTRHRIRGIWNEKDFQVVFSDTPGIIEPHYLLHDKMMDFVKAALADADAVLFITDLEETYMDEEMLNRLSAIKIPVIVVINKVDISSPDEINKLVHGWKKKLNPRAVIPVSAFNDFNVDRVKESILEILPEAPAFFPKDELSDQTERFFIAEIIREKIFLNYEKEIPYSTEVIIDTFKEEKDLIRIRAVIYTERESQKGIIIGNKGESIKQVGTQARKDIEKFLDKKVFLEMFVKVEKEWRKNENKLRRFGYTA
ncbi:MAG: GTPase Era [Bacteroidetes bacterium]|nr:GTPase Era [Bacteroidota bacterium]